MPPPRGSSSGPWQWQWRSRNRLRPASPALGPHLCAGSPQSSAAHEARGEGRRRTRTRAGPADETEDELIALSSRRLPCRPLRRHVLTFQAPLPALGYATFRARRTLQPAAAPASPSANAAALSVVSNGVYEVSVDEASGEVASISNLASGVKSSSAPGTPYYPIL